jgi:hypothetical protein
MTTGQLPVMAKPDSPLIRLLASIPPSELPLIKSLKVSPSLGYTGSRVFANAAQALNWLRPSYSALHYPSQSWQDRRFFRELTIADLMENAKLEPYLIKKYKLEKEEPENDPEPSFNSFTVPT